MINHWKLFGLDEGKGASNRTSEQIDMGSSATLGTATHNNLNQLTSVAGGGQMRVSGTLDEPATVSVSSNGGSSVDASVDGNNNFEATVEVNEGSNTLSITATDYSGNDNTATNNYTVQVTGPGNKTLTYDLNGNLLSDGDKTYTWDAENRLLSITYADSSSTEFAYDGFDRRAKIVEKDNAGVITSDKTFIWGGGAIEEERDSTGAIPVKRFLAQGVEIVGASSPDNKLFYTKDHLGSVRELVDDSQTVRARYNYDPYGRITKVSGDLDADFLYTGHYYHEKSNLSLAWFRAYDADLGRWISRDPIGYEDGPNIYGYVHNNPLNYYDPLGLNNIGHIVRVIVEIISMEQGPPPIQEIPETPPAIESPVEGPPEDEKKCPPKEKPPKKKTPKKITPKKTAPKKMGPSTLRPRIPRFGGGGGIIRPGGGSGGGGRPSMIPRPWSY